MSELTKPSSTQVMEVDCAPMSTTQAVDKPALKIAVYASFKVVQRGSIYMDIALT